MPLVKLPLLISPHLLITKRKVIFQQDNRRSMHLKELLKKFSFQKLMQKRTIKSQRPRSQKYLENSMMNQAQMMTLNTIKKKKKSKSKLRRVLRTKGKRWEN